MPTLRFHVKPAGAFSKNEARDAYGSPCSNNAWDCLNTPAQFGIIFSVIVVVIAVMWIYWYTIIRPRREKIRESGEDIELDLGDGRTGLPQQLSLPSPPHENLTPRCGHHRLLRNGLTLRDKPRHS
ncbi:hypothetical protein UCDDA912_g09310 [Diaporthe ampelina]|uniref:Uncharacterized protein n=1 Tax=Diaporthe ampelina TaxID=1214573 RepID=A0A0G2HRE8_9PEZI|nr:hypothetical protein UCDDA912_g09310 [Diaporthe ampelina]